MTLRSNDALIALRRIQRKTEIAAKRLAQTAGLTTSQLVVMQILNDKGDLCAGDLSQITGLKHATITNLIDKLSALEYVRRRKTEADKRKVWLSLTPAGQEKLCHAPDLLQNVFSHRFSTLPVWEQAMLISSLEKVSALLDAESLEAAPFLHYGALDK